MWLADTLLPKQCRMTPHPLPPGGSRVANVAVACIPQHVWRWWPEVCRSRRHRRSRHRRRRNKKKCSRPTLLDERPAQLGEQLLLIAATAPPPTTRTRWPTHATAGLATAKDATAKDATAKDTELRQRRRDYRPRSKRSSSRKRAIRLTAFARERSPSSSQSTSAPSTGEDAVESHILVGASTPPSV